MVQIAHGMAEHSLRYRDFARYLAQQGFVVSVHDHMGHGKSVSGGRLRLFLAKMATKPWSTTCTACTIFGEGVRAASLCHDGTQHGLLLTGSYLSRFGADITAAVICGTSAGQSPLMMAAGRRIAERTVRRKGAKSQSPLLQKISPPVPLTSDLSRDGRKTTG